MIYDTINDYKKLGRISFAMPGHKNGRGIDFDPRDFDITELGDGVDLHHPNSPVLESLDFLKRFYETDLSLYLTGGSTSGIFIMLSSACKRADTVAVGRGCHFSVINACIFLGLKVVIIPQETDKLLNVLKPVSEKEISRLLTEFPDISAVVITSPTYYGECADIASVSSILHKHKIPLLVDEAHGAHFKASELLPKSAVDLGADICVQSAHKTLGALTSSAFLHVKSNLIDKEHVKKAAAMRETSSPPYYQVVSAERAVKALLSDPYSRLVMLCKKKREDLTSKSKVIMPTGKTYDPTRLVFCFAAYDISGFSVSEILRKTYKIECESADSRNIVCIATPYNTDSEIALLFEAVEEIAKKIEMKNPDGVFSFNGSFSKIDPSNAFYSPHRKSELYMSEGETAAESVYVYPPGIPFIYPGEQISKNAIEILKDLEKKGAQIIGKETFCIVSK